MSMIGATLEDLDGLSTRLQTTSGDVGEVKEQAVGLTARVISEVTASAQQVLAEIGSQMDVMSQSVSAAQSQAESTNWTGANAENFRSGAVEFQTAVNNAGLATNDAFESFKATAHTMSEALDAYVNQLSVALAGAQVSATQMSTSVTNQRNNLESVMNTGISGL